jgi:hypothetical protein
MEISEQKEHLERLLSKIDNEVVKSQIRTLWKYANPEWVVTPAVQEHIRELLCGLAYQLT